MESLTKQEQQFLVYLGYLVLDDARLSERILKEMREEFDEGDSQTAETVLEKLADLIEWRRPSSPMAETGDLKSLQYGFESHLGHWLLLTHL